MSTLKPSEHKSKHIEPGEVPEFGIFYTAAEHWMDFVVIDGGSLDAIDSADGDAIVMEGCIKWDGCINLDIGGRGISYRNHFCSLHGALIVERAMRAIYALAAQHITAWDGDDDA